VIEAQQKSAYRVDLLLLAQVALLRPEQPQLHVLTTFLLFYPPQNLTVDLHPAVLLMSLLYLHQFSVSAKRPIELLDLLLGHDAVVIAANQQHCHRSGNALEMPHVILIEESRAQSIFYLFFQEIKQERNEGLRQAALSIDHPPDYFLQRPEGTVEHKLVDYLVVFCRKENGSDRTHTPPPHRQPLHLDVFISLSENGLSVRRFVDTVSEESRVAIAASNKIERDDRDAMLPDERQHTKYLYLAPSVPVQIEQRLFDRPVLLLEDDRTDVAAVIAGDAKIDAFDEPAIDELLPRAHSVHVVLVPARSNDAPPRSLERLLQPLHYSNKIIITFAVNSH